MRGARGTREATGVAWPEATRSGPRSACFGGMKVGSDGAIVSPMAAYDPNIEHNPKIAIYGALILVILGFGVVAFIVYGSEMKNAPVVEAN